ncbi:hypothetical protein G7069_09190 [Lysobacter sp. HDW10]|uniref:hypothetical protein n=1 Tax=Lysobacter sp. HDW10 TaxID=2714936 RepID=UPI001409B96F|nr:hypothetical protein [Lysobacter sp. HDW10]QIK81752.1 hypothetical protein G7069_09190 [Lysobacter sp. HDW10]
MAMSLLDAQRKLNEILINVEGVADVLEGLADKDGGKRDGPWNTYIMLRNLLNATAAEMIEVMEFLDKSESRKGTVQAMSNGDSA